MGQIHRFRDMAAVSTGVSPGGRGETRYMTATEARKMAAALYRVARSIETESFADSTCGTATVVDMALNDMHAMQNATTRRAAK